MAEVVVDGNELVVRLSLWERLGALRGDIRVPLASITDVRQSDDLWPELRGIRAPGTGFPGVISLCTRRGSFGKDFAAVYGHRPGLVIDLVGTAFQRLVISVADPEVVAAAILARNA